MADDRRPGDPERDEHLDELPADLDVSQFVGPTVFPDVGRRRIAGSIHLILAATCLTAGLQGDQRGLIGAAVLLGVIGAYHFVAGYHQRLGETDALVAATRAVGFPVGHASAQLAWRGLRSRPTWRILLYSADEPPSMRGLVELDALDGTVLGEYTEVNPEDWSEYGLTG
ncbi:MAG: hypothetical protein ACKOZL_00170 [Actinomycetes bacterium]